jgi:hypothetical protein
MGGRRSKYSMRARNLGIQYRWINERRKSRFMKANCLEQGGHGDQKLQRKQGEQGERARGGGRGDKVRNARGEKLRTQKKEDL